MAGNDLEFVAANWQPDSSDQINTNCIRELSWFLESSEMAKEQSPLMFNTICMGGTFDHMHSGHKLLLTQAVMLTRKKMIIGIAADKLLAKK